MSIYRPILRFKRGEQNALKNLSEDIKPLIKPIFCINAHDFNPPEGSDHDEAFDLRVEQNAAKICQAWTNHQAGIDMNNLDPEAMCEGGIHPIKKLFAEVHLNKKPVIINPVFSMDSTEVYLSAVSDICNEYKIAPILRLTPDDLAETDIATFISDYLDRCNINIKDAELVVDMSYISIANRSIITAKGALTAIPFASNWLSITLVSGSFPENLSGFTVGDHVLDRHEWKVWLNNRTISDREIIYGDYATIHPVVGEELDPRAINPTASVRYTYQDTWLLLRGQGTRSRGGSGFEQFYNHADKLFNMPQYSGETFSYGDQKIANIHRRQDTTGNLETWVTIGINHHITEIVDQLATLP